MKRKRVWDGQQRDSGQRLAAFYGAIVMTENYFYVRRRSLRVDRVFA
jgi:hypothetical protein